MVGQEGFNSADQIRCGEMFVKRRNFLGAVIGLVAGSPFIANFDALASEPIAKPKGLKDFRMSIVLDDGTEFWAPGIDSVKADDLGITWNASSIFVTYSMTVKYLRMYYPDGKLCFSQYNSLPVCNGDLIRLSHSIPVAWQVPENWEEWRDWLEAHKREQAEKASDTFCDFRDLAVANKSQKYGGGIPPIAERPIPKVYLRDNFGPDWR